MIERQWIIMIALIVLAILVLDELTLLWWKQATPGYMYLKQEKLPLADKPRFANDYTYPNGHRPAGGP